MQKFRTNIPLLVWGDTENEGINFLLICYAFRPNYTVSN